MSAKQLAKLRALPISEVERRYANAIMRGNITAKWRYYFELTLRKLENLNQ